MLIYRQLTAWILIVWAHRKFCGTVMSYSKRGLVEEGLEWYRLTQVLTGHGCFGRYLFQIRREDTPGCHCLWALWATVWVLTMVRGEEAREAVTSSCEAVMLAKEEDERERERQSDKDQAQVDGALCFTHYWWDSIGRTVYQGCGNVQKRYCGPGTQRATEGTGWVFNQ